MAKQRYPLVQAFMSRDGSLGAKDAYVLNGYMDTYQGKNYVVKRPGTIFAIAGNGGTTQGFFYYQGLYYSVANDTLYISGTQNSGSTLTNWQIVPTNPVTPWSRRYGHGCVAFQNNIFVISGLTQSTFGPADVYKSADGKNWSSVASGSIFAQRYKFGCVVFQGSIFVMGGYGINETTGTLVLYNDVWSSPDGVTWTQVTGNAPWVPRGGFGCVVGNNGIFVIGGSSTAPPALAANLNDVWFSSDGTTWTQVLANNQLALQPPGRTDFGCLFFNGKLWAIGGISTAQVWLQDTWSSPDGVVWTETHTTGFGGLGLAAMGAVVYNQTMWLFEGTTAAGTYTANQYHSVDGVTWTQVVPGSSPGN